MKSSRIISLIAVIVLTFGTAAFAAKSNAKVRLHAHGLSARGSIVAVDEKARTMEVKESNGKTVDFAWTEATHLPKVSLTTGERVNIRYMRKDGKNVATVITTPRAMQKAAAKAAPAKAAPAKSVATKSTKSMTKSTAKASPAKSTSTTKSSSSKAPAPKKG